jgi:hypothetical protein
MKCPPRSRRLAATATLALSIAFGTALGGCRTTNDDIHRWGNTAQGPRKLVAVLTHDKYSMDLRIEAAMTLVGMRPRAGRRIGVGNLVDALNQLPEADRTKVVSGMVPRLEAEIRKPPTGTAEARVDDSIASKDAAYALLTNEGGPLVTDKGEVEKLHDALIQWTVTDFAARMDDSSQSYGMEQLLRMLGAAGVRGLPNLIRLDAPKLDRISDLIGDLGDAPTKLAASERLVAVAKEITSEKWLKSRAPRLEAANKASKMNPTPAQFAKQLDKYQEEELLRAFGSMKKIGQAPIARYLLDFASDKSQSPERRSPALLALEGKIDKDDKEQVEKVLALAGGEDTPDAVRDAALRRVGEMPRKLVIDRLYAMFDNTEWKIRWVAAELVLKMSDATHVDEFMNRIGRVRGMSITEPLRYGSLIGELKGGKVPVTDVIDKYAGAGSPTPARLSALGYYYEAGTAADLPKVERYASDPARVPECLPDAKECEWKCTVEEGATQEEKSVATVGDFVSFCVKPALSKRGAPKAKVAGAK